ncbi:MAG TPA: hypothetical protein VH253_02050 [Phycisphaerae bacterium]|nr:hypothetical protein [Phycisphaerae bacterium]
MSEAKDDVLLGYGQAPLDYWQLEETDGYMEIHHCRRLPFGMVVILLVMLGGAYLVFVVGDHGNWLGFLGISAFFCLFAVGVNYYWGYSYRRGPSFHFDKATGRINMDWVHQVFASPEGMSVQFISGWQPGFKMVHNELNLVCRLADGSRARFPIAGGRDGERLKDAGRRLAGSMKVPMEVIEQSYLDQEKNR